MIVRIKKDSDFNKSDLVMPYSLFPYANYSFYGLNKKIFSLYKTGNCFFSKYDDSIQICSETINENEVDDISDFVRKKKIRMVTAKPEIALKLAESLGNNDVSCRKEDGYIFEINIFEKSNSDVLITAKHKEDFRRMAHIVCLANYNNPHFYKERQLYRQYYMRSLSGYCRNFFIEQNNTIVGCISTYCEVTDYCVLGGLAVPPAFQKNGYGRQLFLGALNKLFSENKKIYLFCYNSNLFNLYNRYSNAKKPISKILILK